MAIVAGQAPYHKPTDYVPYQLLNDYKSAPNYKLTHLDYKPAAEYSEYKPTNNEPYHPVPVYQKPVYTKPSYTPYSLPKYPSTFHSYSVKY